MGVVQRSSLHSGVEVLAWSTTCQRGLGVCEPWNAVADAPFNPGPHDPCLGSHSVFPFALEGREATALSAQTTS